MLKPSLEVLEDRTVLNFSVLPPEINSALLFSGSGSGPLLSATAAWNGLAAELSTAASSYDAVISGLTSQAWTGPSSASASQAAAPYVGWLSSTAGQAEAAASQASAAASAYETAFAMTVPPQLIAANRAALTTLVATNFLGQNTPAIAATEADYTEMWAQDLAAMPDYADAALASPSTGVVPAAADEISAATAALFGTYAQEYQALSSQTAAFHEQFVQALNAASGQYANTESANPGATG